MIIIVLFSIGPNISIKLYIINVIDKIKVFIRFFPWDQNRFWLFCHCWKLSTCSLEKIFGVPKNLNGLINHQFINKISYGPQFRAFNYTFF